MGSYASYAVRDSSGNIIGYQSAYTGQVTYEPGFSASGGSDAYKAITSQYAQQHYNTVGSGGAYRQSIAHSITPTYYDTNTAAGIAALIGRTGGAVDVNLARRAVSEGFSPSAINLASARDTSVSGYAIPASRVYDMSQIKSGVETLPTQTNVVSPQLSYYSGSSPSTELMPGVSFTGDMKVIGRSSSLPSQSTDVGGNIWKFVTNPLGTISGWGREAGANVTVKQPTTTSGQQYAAQTYSPIVPSAIVSAPPNPIISSVLNPVDTTLKGFGIMGGAIGGGVKAAGDWVSNIIPRTTAIEPVVTKSYFVPNKMGAGTDIGSPMVGTNTLPPTAISQGETFNVPLGNVAKTEIRDAKAVYDPTSGTVGFYQVPKSIYEKEGGFKRIYGIETSSGGAGALQSGMFTVGKGKAGTDVVYTQESAGTKFAEGYNKERAADILKTPWLYSRSGAEAYGGDVTRLDSRILSPSTQMGRYASETGNLANLVSPTGVNQPRSEWATEPWSIDWNASPVLQTVNVKGELAPTSGAELKSVGIGAMPPETKMAELMPGVALTGGMKVVGSATPQPQEPSFVSTMATKETKPTGAIFGTELPIISPVLAFFQPGTTTTTKTGTPTILPETTIVGKPVAETIGGVTTTTTPYTTTGGNVTPITTIISSTPSGWDKLQENIRTTLNLPSPEVGEKMVKYATAVLPTTWALTMPSTISEFIPASKETKQVSSIINPFAGQYTQFYEQPLLVPISYGVGAAGGTLFKGAETIFGTGKSVAVPLLESTGKAGTAAKVISTISTPIIEQAPKILGGLYAADVGYRSTKGLTEFAPEKVSSTAKGLILQEAVPMGAGFALPGKISSGIKGIKTGFEEYKSMIAERETSIPHIGLTPTEGEVVLTTYATKTPTFGEYAKYSLRKATPEAILNFPEYITSASPRYGLRSDIGNLPTKIGRYIESAPEYLYAGAKEIGKLPSVGVKVIAEPIVTARITAVPRAQAALGRASIDIAVLKYGERAPVMESLYNKYFTTKLNLPVSAENALISGETKLWEIGQLAKTPSITVKSFWQEHKPSIEWEGAPRYVYSLKFGKTTVPSIGDVSGYSVGGIKKGVTPSAPSFGGFERIKGTKVIGGRTVPSLSIEKPTRSLLKTERDITEKMEPSGFAKTKVQYFGEHPTTMKPMGKVEGKQAAGQIQIMSESLPKVEGLQTGKIPTTIPYPLFIPQLRQGQKEVVTEMEIPKAGLGMVSLLKSNVQQEEQLVKPSLEFAQISKYRTDTLSLPSLLSTQTLKDTQDLILTSEVAQKQKESYLMYDISKLVSTTTVPSYKEETRQAQREEQFIKTAPIVDIVPKTKTTTKTETTTITEPKIITTTEPKIEPVIEPEIIIPPLFGGWGGLGGGGGGSDKRRRFKKHVEVFEYKFDPWKAARITAKALAIGSNVTGAPASSLPSFSLQATRKPAQKPTKTVTTPRVAVPKFNMPVQRKTVMPQPQKKVSSPQIKTPTPQRKVAMPQFTMPKIGVPRTTNTLKSMSLPSSLPTQKKKGKK
jgi:hypothetical protein